MLAITVKCSEMKTKRIYKLNKIPSSPPAVQQGEIFVTQIILARCRAVQPLPISASAVKMYIFFNGSNEHF